jgi:uncharacterized protein
MAKKPYFLICQPDNDIMPKIIHFDIAAEDPEKSMEFYQKVFGWKFEKWEGPTDYWFMLPQNPDEEKEEGILGAIARKEKPGEGVMNTFGVTDIDTYLAKIQAAGGRITGEKHAIPGIGYLAYFEDIDGNEFGIMEDDPEA